MLERNFPRRNGSLPRGLTPLSCSITLPVAETSADPHRGGDSAPAHPLGVCPIHPGYVIEIIKDALSPYLILRVGLVNGFLAGLPPC
jgi:hypothetical protein